MAASSSSSSSSLSSSLSSSCSVTATCPVMKSRKRELKKIENAASREVTFSKRRKGLFGKASELSLLCGAEIAILTYSPHGNPFVFGTGTGPGPTSADEILLRFAAGKIVPSSRDGALLRDWNSLPLLDETQRQRQDLGRYWWDDPVDENDIDLESYIESVEKLRGMVTRRLDELRRSSPIPATSTVDSADHPNSEMAVVNCCTEAGLQLGFGEFGRDGAGDVWDFDWTGSNFHGMTPSTDNSGHPDPIMAMLDSCTDADTQVEEVWEELGLEEGRSSAASVSGTPSLEEGTAVPALEWTDADFDDMLESIELDANIDDQPEIATFDWASEDIEEMLGDWGSEAPSLHFLQDM